MTSTEVQNLQSRNKNAGRRQSKIAATRLDRFYALVVLAAAAAAAAVVVVVAIVA